MYGEKITKKLQNFKVRFIQNYYIYHFLFCFGKQVMFLTVNWSNAISLFLPRAVITSFLFHQCCWGLNNECNKFLPLDSSIHDGIRADVLKKSLYLVSMPLLHILNLSFSSGVFPNELKLANVTPVFNSLNAKPERSRVFLPNAQTPNPRGLGFCFN